MSYIKQTVILKETKKGFSFDSKMLSGITKIEVEDGIATLNLSLINLCAKDGGEYYLCITDGKNDLFCFSLGKTPMARTFVFNETPEVSFGFTASLVFICDNPITIAFGKSANFTFSQYDAERLIKKHFENSQKVINNTQIEYEDEAVATENYYLNDDVDIENLSVEKPIKNYEDIILEETPISPTDFYKTVESELEQIFNNYERESLLEQCLPNSKFAKINYGNNKFYVTGVIYENNIPQYICYGVPSKYSPTPPDSLNGISSFIPLSLFDTRGDGYWMIFQDAKSGKCIKFE